MVCEFEMKDGLMRVNCSNCVFGSSVEDFDVCFGKTIDKILQAKKVERIILVGSREFEYDYEQTKILVEIANVYDKLVNRDKILNYANLGREKCERCFPRRFADLQFLLTEMLRKDPIGAYVKVKRMIRYYSSKAQKEKTMCRRCYDFYVNNTLIPIKDALEKTSLIQMVKDRLHGYKLGDRSLYRDIFRPLIRPKFMLTRYMSMPPEGGRPIDRYYINGILVEIFKVPGSVRHHYHVTPPEFKLSDEKYSILDTARRYLAEHKPSETEVIQPELARETFMNMGRDIAGRVSRDMGLRLSEKELNEMANILARYTAGFGILEVLLSDEKIQDIYINSPIGLMPIYITHDDFEECETNLIPTREDAEGWATRFRMLSGRPLDEANPVLDTELFVPGGRARVCAITRTLSPEGIGYALRRHRERPWTYPLFLNVKFFDPLFAGLMSFFVEGARSLLISGGRSSGKCVTGDTLVQLADGKIKPIRNVVNTVLKKNDPIEFEDGEIGIPENLEVLTLDGSLKIKRSMVDKVWRRKAPTKVVRIRTRSGKEVVTTPEHPYFVIKDGDVKTLPANKLKRNEWIATPRKIRLTPSYSRSFNIFDLPDDSYIFGVYDLFLSKIKSLKCSLIKISKKLGIDYNVLRYSMNSETASVKVEIIKKLIKKMGLKDEFSSSMKKMKVGTNSIPIKIPKVDENFMSFVGYLLGDGSIEKGSVSFHNENEDLRNKFMDICEKLWGMRGKVEFPKGRVPKVVIRSGVLVKFWNYLGFPLGRKSSRIKLPERFLKLGDKELKAFLKSYFDCDASVSKEDREIELSTASKIMAKQTQWLLLRFGIISSIGMREVKNEDYYRVWIRGEFVNEFVNIGFSHPFKSRRLISLVRRTWKRGVYDNVPNIEKLLVETIKKMRAKISRNERKLLKPDVYQRKEWLVSRKKLIAFTNFLKKREGEILSLRNDVEKLKDYKISVLSGKKLVSELKGIIEELGISYSEIGRVSGLNGTTVEHYFKGRFADLEKVKKICETSLNMISQKVRKFDGKLENFLNIINNTTLTFAEVSRKTKISETTLNYYAHGKIRNLIQKDLIEKCLHNFLNNWNEKVERTMKRIPELKSLLDIIKAFNPSETIKRVIKTLNIENKEIARSTNVSTTTLSYIDKWVVRPETFLKIIRVVERIWDEINSKRTRNSLRTLELLANSDIFWDKLELVEEVKPKEPYVYDLTVEGTHNFIGNGIIAHNTSLLSATLLEIMKKFRIVTVEDTLEIPVIQMRNLGYNIERLKSRSVITRVEAELPAEEALRTAIRLGDACLIVGEVRSKEAGSLYEAMRIGALTNVVAGTIHGESAYGVFDRVVNDLGVPPTSFKATDILVICGRLRTADGLHTFRRVLNMTEVRKHWREDPVEEGGFVNLMEYSAKEDKLKPTDTLINGESFVINEIAKRVKEWHGDWDAVWSNIELRGKIKQTILDYAKKLKRKDILEADWVSKCNEMFHMISDEVKREIGVLDSKEIFNRWNDWFKNELKAG